jgi:DNA-binding CsgD family transcriptional regulator
VKNHLHALYSKLGVESRGQAISEAIRRGLATP